LVPARQSHYRLNSKAAVFDKLKIPFTEIEPHQIMRTALKAPM